MVIFDHFLDVNTQKNSWWWPMAHVPWHQVTGHEGDPPPTQTSPGCRWPPLTVAFLGTRQRLSCPAAWVGPAQPPKMIRLILDIEWYRTHAGWTQHPSCVWLQTWFFRPNVVIILSTISNIVNQAPDCFLAQTDLGLKLCKFLHCI